MVVSYKHIDIQIGNSPILTDVNLEIGEKEFVFLTGKVGSGKTSLLRTLYGMLPVQGEEARVLEYDMKTLKHKKLPELRRKMGIIFQDFQLLPDRTVVDNLDFVLKATGWKKKPERMERIEEVLQIVGLQDKASQFPHELSGGEQQRVAIARSILNRPQLIVADEPTGNLDIETSRNIVDILHSLTEQQGTTIVMSTHNIQLLQLIEARIFHCDNHQLREQTSLV